MWQMIFQGFQKTTRSLEDMKRHLQNDALIICTKVFSEPKFLIMQIFKTFSLSNLLYSVHLFSTYTHIRI